MKHLRGLVLPIVEGDPRPIFAVEEGDLRLILSEDEETMRFFRDLESIIRGLAEESGVVIPGIQNNILPAEPIRNLVGMADLINSDLATELAEESGSDIPDIIVEKKHEM